MTKKATATPEVEAIKPDAVVIGDILPALANDVQPLTELEAEALPDFVKDALPPNPVEQGNVSPIETETAASDDSPEPEYVTGPNTAIKDYSGVSIAEYITEHEAHAQKDAKVMVLVSHPHATDGDIHVGKYAGIRLKKGLIGHTLSCGMTTIPAEDTPEE